MNAFRRLFAARGAPPVFGPDPADDDPADVLHPDSSGEGAGATGFLDSVRLPCATGEPEEETIVRPALAILFRIAVGPGADYYVPRCLAYERSGRSFPGWNWAPLVAPGVWAFYRRLWLPAIAFTVWPLLAFAVLRFVEPELGDSGAAWVTAALLVIWLVPRIVGALTGNALVYRRARLLVRDAEARTWRPERAAQWLSRRAAIAPLPAVLAGTATAVLALHAVIPGLQSAYHEQVVRSRIAESLAAIRPLQRQIETWFASRSYLHAPDLASAGTRTGTQLLDAISVSRTSGRVRLALGPLIPELSGRAILLAPALDRRRQVHWICIPVDVPERYLPPECRQG